MVSLQQSMAIRSALRSQEMENVIASPIGSIVMYAGSADTEEFYICDGRQLSQTTYADLYAVIGDTYTASPGPTYFRIPDLRSRFVVGACGVMTSPPFGLTKYDPGDIGGSEGHILTTDEVGAHNHDLTVFSAPHTHALTDPGHTHALTDPGHTHGGTPNTRGGLYIEGAPEAGRGSQTDSATTNITMANAITGAVVVEATAGVSVVSSPTPVALPHENRPPYMGLCYLIRVG
jgi:microcystin-dependent protein